MTDNKSLIEQAEKLLKENPSSTSAYTQLGNAYLQEKQRNKAREHFLKAIAIDSKNIHAYLGLGQAAFSREEAIKYLDQAVSINPNNAEAYLLLGRTYRKFRKNQKAIDYLKKALTIDERNVDGWIDLGICHFYENDVDTAIACMKKAIDLDPKSYKGYTNLCQYYYKIHQYQAAIDHGKKAIDIDAHSWNAFFNISFPLFASGDYDSAIQALQTVISINSRDRYANYQLGNVYIAVGNYKDAQAAFQRAVDIDPTYEPAHMGLGNVFVDVGQPAEALKEFRHKRYSGISRNLDDNSYALEVGKRNLANRAYLHIKSLRNMATYFESIQQQEAQQIACFLNALHRVLVEKKLPDITTIKDQDTIIVIMQLYKLLTDKDEYLHSKRKQFFRIKETLEKHSSGNVVLTMLSNRWTTIEQYLQESIPVAPRLEIKSTKAENLIYQESGSIRLVIKNKGLLPAQNVLVKVQPSNEFSPKEREIKIPLIGDSEEIDINVYVYTQGPFSITVQASFDGGQETIETFRFNAFRKNPFFYGRPVKEPEMFFGREQLLDKILDRVKNVAKQDILVHGIRRIGKTSLLYQIKNRLQIPMVPVYFSLQQIGEVDDTSLLRQLLYEICDAVGKIAEFVPSEMKKRNIPTYITGLKPPYAFDITTRAFRKDLEALLAYTKELAPGIRIVVLLDEGDLFFKIGIHMQRFMRDLLQRYDQIVMIMAGSPKIIELSTTTYDSPFYNNFAHENLVGLEFKEAKGLIQSPMQALGVSCGMDIAKEIFNYCGGISYYIQAVCYHLLTETYGKKKTECSRNELQFAEDKVFSELRRSFDAVWEEFNEEQQFLLQYLSQCEDAISRSEPSLKKMNAQILTLSEYSIIAITDDNIAIKAELIKKWIREMYKYD